MKLIKEIKCLCCLFKCSKYLYYVKKALCVVTIIFALTIGVSYFSSERNIVAKLKEMM